MTGYPSGSPPSTYASERTFAAETDPSDEGMTRDGNAGYLLPPKCELVRVEGHRPAPVCARRSTIFGGEGSTPLDLRSHRLSQGAFVTSMVRTERCAGTVSSCGSRTDHHGFVQSVLALALVAVAIGLCMVDGEELRGQTGPGSCNRKDGEGHVNGPFLFKWLRLSQGRLQVGGPDQLSESLTRPSGAMRAKAPQKTSARSRTQLRSQDS
jgi:hypothetical protein